MKRMRQALGALALLFAAIAAINGEEPKPATNALPKTLTVKEVLAIIGKTKITGQGCGDCTWNGESRGAYFNIYKSMKLPWDTEPRRVEAGFADGNGGKGSESHLFEFNGPGFRYERLTDVPELTLKPPTEKK